MTQITLRLEGFDKIRIGLNRWERSVAPLSKKRVRTAAYRAMKRSVPYLGGSSYAIPERGTTRTGNLGRSTFVVEDGQSFRIESRAINRGRSYSELVIGRADGGGQASVHDGWWLPLARTVDDEVLALTSDIEYDLQNSAEAAGL